MVFSQIYQELSVIHSILSNDYRTIMPNINFFLVKQTIEGQKEYLKMKWRPTLVMKVIGF